MTGPEATSGRTGSFRPILGAAVFLFIAVLAMAGVKGYRDLEASRQRRQLLENHIQETQSEIARLRNRIDRLHSDPGALERLAREDLGLVRPGDVVIELPQDPVPPKPGTILPSPAVLPPITPPITPPVAPPVIPSAPTVAPMTAPASVPIPADRSVHL